MQFNEELVVTPFYEGVAIADILSANTGKHPRRVEEKQVQVMGVILSQDLLRDRIIVSDGSASICVDTTATGSGCITSAADPSASIVFASERRLVRVHGTVALEGAAIDSGASNKRLPYIKAALLSVIEEADMLRYRKALEMRRILLKRQGLIGKGSISYYHSRDATTDDDDAKHESKAATTSGTSSGAAAVSESSSSSSSSSSNAPRAFVGGTTTGDFPSLSSSSFSSSSSSSSSAASAALPKKNEEGKERTGGGGVS
jgi:hypothetical protein